MIYPYSAFGGISAEKLASMTFQERVESTIIVFIFGVVACYLVNKFFK